MDSHKQYSVPKEKFDYTAAILTLSDRASKGIYADESGEVLKTYCQDYFSKPFVYEVLPDEPEVLKAKILQLTQNKIDLLLLTGGTGIGPRDMTPDVVKSLSIKELSGFGELQRQHGAQYTKLSWFSRASAYVVGTSFVVLFPGNPKAVRQGLQVLAELIPHGVRMIRGEKH